jgi:glycerophosphoryl diester phosphodiesterase
MNNKSCLLLLLIFLTACHAVKKSKHLELPIFDKQGHRGSRGLMPENTIPAMLKAIDLGVTTLETDVVVTKDGQLVLSHEPFFNNAITTAPAGKSIEKKDERTNNIFQMDYRQVKEFDVGMKVNNNFPRQEKIAVFKPLLKDMIDSVKLYCKKNKLPVPFFNIETKSNPATDYIFHPAPAEFVRLLMDVIESKKIKEKTIIQSFDIRTLKVLHNNYSGLKTSLLIEDYNKRTLDENLKELGFTPTIYSPHYSLVDNDLIKACQKRNMKIIPWTVNSKSEIDRLKSLGVDGIISDYPDLF